MSHLIMLPIRLFKERHVRALPGPLPGQTGKFQGKSGLVFVANGHERPGATSI